MTLNVQETYHFTYKVYEDGLLAAFFFFIDLHVSWLKETEKVIFDMPFFDR